jgi:hypothetical protein
MHRRCVIGVLLLTLALLAGCAPGVNPEVGTPNADGVVAGFWLGLWHGIIAPVTFLISLFVDDINIYEVHNSGNWYDFGFMLGIGALAGGGSSGSRYGRRR